MNGRPQVTRWCHSQPEVILALTYAVIACLVGLDLLTLPGPVVRLSFTAVGWLPMSVEIVVPGASPRGSALPVGRYLIYPVAEPILLIGLSLAAGAAIGRWWASLLPLVYALVENIQFGLEIAVLVVSAGATTVAALFGLLGVCVHRLICRKLLTAGPERGPPH